MVSWRIVQTAKCLGVECHGNVTLNERPTLNAWYDWECQPGTKRKQITQTWKFARISKIASQRHS